MLVVKLQYLAIWKWINQFGYFPLFFDFVLECSYEGHTTYAHERSIIKEAVFLFFGWLHHSGCKNQ